MESEHYMNMLVDLSNEIRPEELHALKFMSSQYLTKRRLEKINDTNDLWTALQEADMINKDDTSFLQKLLENACKSRADLLKLYKHYTEKHVTAVSRRQEQKVYDILNKEFDVVVANIGRDWRSLARKLGLTEADIDCIIDSHQGNLREQCRDALRQWAQDYTDEKKAKHRLIRALEKCEKKALANKVANCS